jgi:hypothetical protein
MAGWGCPDPRGSRFDFLSDGHDTPEEAVAAAQRAWRENDPIRKDETQKAQTFAATIAVRAAENDRRVTKENLIGEAESMIHRLTQVVAELRDNDTFSLIALATIEQNDLASAVTRFKCANTHLNQTRTLVESLGFDVEA